MRQDTALEILKTGRNCFLTGAAGTGKTYVLNRYIEYLRENNIPVAITASTGIAATHLGGQTIHSWSGIGIKDRLTDWDIDAICQKESLVRKIQKTSVLIIDEISMLKSTTLDSINSVLKAIRQREDPFGGMQVVLSGDFFQLPPVVKMGESMGDVQSVFAFSSYAWIESGFKVLYLTEQFRQQDELVEILNAIREREITEDLVEKIKDREGLFPEEENPVRLHTHNKNVDEVNEEELGCLSGKVMEYPMELAGNKAKAENMARNILAPEILRVKEGARVMFVKNSVSGDYVNGTLGTVVKFKFGVPVVMLDDGKEIELQMSTWEMVNESGKVVASVSQYPIRLAWAITVHKSQGMSIDSAIMNLSNTFVEGQGYVALSRVRTLNGLFLEGINPVAFRINDLVFEYDQSFQMDSESVEDVFDKYSDEKKGQMQKEFVSNNSLKDKDIKIPTHIETINIFISGNRSLKKIAKDRNLKSSTIITHFEKAQEEGVSFDISELKEINDLNFDEIFSVFNHMGFNKLSPVHSKFKGKYDFDSLRLARIAYKQNEGI